MAQADTPQVKGRTTFAALPPGYKRFQGVLEGGPNDSGEVFFIAAENEKEASAWLDKLREEKGYFSAGISSEEEAKERMELGDETYRFSFPDDDKALLVDAEIGELPTVYVVSPETIADELDPDRQAIKARERALARREERRRRAKPLSDGETK